MKLNITQAVILAGGLGTRLKPFTDTNPKPMIEFENKPFLEYIVLQLKSFGLYNILILLGYLPDVIMDYFGDGKKFGVKITYDVTTVEQDTGSRIRNAKDKIEQHFMLLYCDNYCPLEIGKIVDTYNKNKSLVQITAYANRDNYTKNNIRINEDGYVECYDKDRTEAGLKAVDIGYSIINKDVINMLPRGNINFERALYSQLVYTKELSVYVTEHRYYSIGSWERIKLTKEFFKQKKVVFLDRDGTLNVKAPVAEYIQRPEEFIWLEGAVESIKLLKDNDYICIIISNQPGIARQKMSIADLEKIHQKMLEDLRIAGTGIDKIYYCPHGWDEGCECRKPKPGMLYMAQKEFSLNLTDCILIGDDERDMDAGKAVGCKTYFVDEKNSLLSIVKKIVKMAEI